ncbi:glycoside hydrolase family 3 protein [Actinocorallia populi]|uniref:glycoside hydrolase family 3 protein n=1 Tax=Actinocorallia populi TaxID=2079200 RepID=UPI000D0961E0|nr:glycoside hydrolase family 3 protein [Actinocorallia populi]
MGVRIIALVLGGVMLAGCSSGGGESERAAAPAAPGTPESTAQEGTQQTGALAAELLQGMSVREKVGQLFMPTVRDAVDGKRIAKKYRVGGFIYFPGNLSSPQETAKLSNALQASSRVPLLLGVDEETGLVTRAKFATDFPGAMALAATGDAALARAAAAATGAELRAAGVNLNFAPVADVNVNPDNPVIGVRSFGADPALAGRMVTASVEGYRAAGVAAVAKHFPGHGDTNVDSHTGLPVIKSSRQKWEEVHAPPFQAAITAGVDAIMTGHLVVPALDSSRKPATMSEQVLTGLLRGRLGFQGVIVTDSLSMAGAKVPGGAPEAAVRAVLAGADLLLMPPDLAAAHAKVLKAVESGRIPAARLDDAVTRILRLKENRGLFTDDGADPATAAQAVSAANRQTAQQVATNAVTVVGNRDAALPLKGPVHVEGPERERVAAALRKEGVRTSGEQAAKTRVVVVTSAGSATRDRLKDLASGNRKVVYVAIASPYALRYGGPAHASVATYSGSAASLRGLARVLTGRTPPKGRLPVSLPDGAPLGSGVTDPL